MKEEKLTPNFLLIKKYVQDGCVNEQYFNNHMEYFSRKPSYISVKRLINKHTPKDDNLYFFWICYYDGAQFTKWMKDVELFKIWNTYNKDLAELKKLFKEFKSSYFNSAANPRKTVDRSFLHSISFKLENERKVPTTTTITAHPLLHDLFTQLMDWVEKKEHGQKQKVKNKSTYFKEFIKNTYPFFLYLKDNHFKEKSNNDTYEFIGKFLECVEVDWENASAMPAKDYIKEAYKSVGSKKGIKGKTLI